MATINQVTLTISGNTGSYVQREYTNQQGAKRSILELRATDLAVSLRAGTVAYNKAPRDNGFAGRTPQPSQPMAQPQPPQPIHQLTLRQRRLTRSACATTLTTLPSTRSLTISRPALPR